jgi:hypothetical protein
MSQSNVRRMPWTALRTPCATLGRGSADVVGGLPVRDGVHVGAGRRRG